MKQPIKHPIHPAPTPRVAVLTAFSIVFCSTNVLAQTGSTTNDASASGGIRGEQTIAPDTSLPVNDDDVSPESGFEWGLGVGVALPLGNADSGSALYNDDEGVVESFRIRGGEMSGVASYRVPLALDLGYRSSPPWWVGLRAEAGLGGFGDECPTAASCHFTDARLMAWVKHHFSPNSSTDPWLGVGLGYEWLSVVAQVALEAVEPSLPFYQAVSAQQTLSGPLLMVQGGLGFDLGEDVRVGPYIGAALGRFVWTSFECPNELGCPDNAFVDDGSFHGWLSVGVAGTHGP